jgi:GNAT superfamily N-acetyltransferase
MNGPVLNPPPATGRLVAGGQAARIPGAGHDEPMDVEIRPAAPADGERLGRMHYASWREAYASFLPPGFWGEAAERRRISNWVAALESPAPGSATWIAVRDEEILGFVTAGPARDNPTAGAPVRERELWAIYIRASEYGTGLADRLLELALPGEAPAELWAFEANGRALRFYARHGFTPDGARHRSGPELGHQAEIRLVR